MRKGGTTSLFEYLVQHPAILAARKKELHYFNLNYDKGEDWYRQQFPFKWKKGISGEGTPAYLFHPEAPKRIRQVLPDVKLIFLFRDPVERAFSNFKMNIRLGWEQLDSFQAAIEREYSFMEEELVQRSASPPVYSRAYHNHAYLHQGCYGHHLQQWLQYFSKNQLLIVDSWNFFQDPKLVLEKCYDFLGLTPRFPDDLTARNVGNYRDTISEGVVVELRRFYQEDSALLEQLTGKRFSWME